MSGNWETSGETMAVAWPIETMDGAPWNILDATGCRIAVCGYDEMQMGSTRPPGKEAYQQGSRIAWAIVGMLRNLKVESEVLREQLAAAETRAGEAEAKLHDAEAVNESWLEEEAKVCPEDVGFAEYIKALQSDLAAATGRVEELEDKYREEYATVARVWKALGISTYEQSKPYEISEHVANLKAQLGRVEEAARNAASFLATQPAGCLGRDPEGGHYYRDEMIQALQPGEGEKVVDPADAGERGKGDANG